MASKLVEEGSVPVSAKEAEAVFELWARRQCENDPARAQTTVKDLAEAMAIPPHEVLVMLGEVRGASPAPMISSQELAARRRNRILMAVAGVTWIAILVFAIGLAYARGRATSVAIPQETAAGTPQPDFVGTTGGPTAGSTIPSEAATSR